MKKDFGCYCYRCDNRFRTKAGDTKAGEKNTRDNEKGKNNNYR